MVTQPVFLCDPITDSPSPEPAPNSPPIANNAEAIHPVLHRQRGSLDVVMLIDQAGQPVGVDSAVGQDAAIFDALLALAKRVLHYDPAAGWDLAGTDDPIIFFDWDGQQILCKAFAADNRTWLLVALAPPDKPFRQTIGKAIKALQAVLIPPAPPKPRKPRAVKAPKEPKMPKEPKPPKAPKESTPKKPRAKG